MLIQSLFSRDLKAVVHYWNRLRVEQNRMIPNLHIFHSVINCHTVLLLTLILKYDLLNEEK